jgi:hypothetical protein
MSAEVDKESPTFLTFLTLLSLYLFSSCFGTIFLHLRGNCEYHQNITQEAQSSPSIRSLMDTGETHGIPGISRDTFSIWQVLLEFPDPGS